MAVQDCFLAWAHVGKESGRLGQIPGLIEWWLRRRGLAESGGGACSLWGAVTSAETLAMPPACEFSLNSEAFSADLHVDSNMLARGERPLATAWCRVAWECALAEVGNRYDSQDKFVIHATGGEDPEREWTMKQVCERDERAFMSVALIDLFSLP